jgi:F-type H+-transporting ATPase subunit epsilon
MSEFHLKIVTPDGLKFDGMAQSLLVKSASGDVEILAHHADYFASLGTGRAKISTGGEKKLASCSGGFVSVGNNEVTLVATTFEFKEQIDLERAKQAKENAEKAISEAKDSKEIDILRAKLARALSRISVSEGL